jgi:hypothetical protein
VLRQTERQSQWARGRVYAQRADLGVRDGESRGWASGIRAAPAQRPDNAALVEQLEHVYDLSNCARRPRPARCIQRAHAHSAVVRTRTAVALVRGAAKNRHACFHNAGQRLQCDAVSASGSGKEQGAAEKVLRHAPPWTPILPDRHNLARCHFGQSHPWQIAGIGGSLTLTGPGHAIASYWAAERCDRRIRTSNNCCEHPAHGTHRCRSAVLGALGCASLGGPANLRLQALLWAAAALRVLSFSTPHPCAHMCQVMHSHSQSIRAADVFGKRDC